MSKKYYILLKYCLHNSFMGVLKSEPIWLIFVADIYNYKLIPNINTNMVSMAITIYMFTK